MSGIVNYLKTAGLTAALVCGMTVVSGSAQAHDYSQVRHAQQELKNQGYYNGAVDGVDGPMTQEAIRRYQADKNLKVNGRLDDETRDRLRRSGAATGEANRSVTHEANRSVVESTEPFVPTSATISAAQRSLERKGFYKGSIDGSMGPRTQAALREFQRNSNLNVTGRLDRATLSSLGVSK